MMDFSKYQYVVYQDGGRGNGVYDCWGLVREVLHQYFNVPLLASYGSILPQDKASMTRCACELIQRGFVQTHELREGVVVAGYIGQRMQHVGVCVRIDGLLRVLHAHHSGVRFERLHEFEKLSGSSLRLFQYSPRITA